MSQTVLQKELFRAIRLRIRTYRKKTAKTLARFLKSEPDKMNKMQFNKQAIIHAQIFILFLDYRA